jgi:ankyrin repeat protein
MVGITPLMIATVKNDAGIVKLLLKQGADGTRGTTHAALGLHAGSTALDIARSLTDDNADFAETLAAGAYTHPLLSST